MSHWQFVIRPLTPIHIGAGEPIEPYEYTIVDGTMYRLDLDRFLSALPRVEALAFADWTGQDPAAARAFLQGRAPVVEAHAEYRCVATPAVAENYEERLEERFADLTLRPTVRAGGMAILPGSSIKGAIRTALLYHRMKKPVDSGRYRRQHTQLQRDVFGHRNPLDDPFKALKISDTLPPYRDAGRLDLAEVHVYREREGVWGPTRRGRLVMRLETTSGSLTRDSSLELRHQVQIDEGWQRRARAHFDVEVGELIAACRHFYDEHLMSEADFMATFPPAAAVYAALRDWRRQMPDHAFLLRLGWGSGLDGVSVNRALTRPKRTISRRLLDDGTPLGWAEVQVYDAQGQPFAVTEDEAPPPQPPSPPPLPPGDRPTHIADLRPGMKLSGVVQSVVDFGAFVDIGVGKDGLIHSSEMGRASLYRGQKIDVWVIRVEPERQRIGLSLIGPGGKKGGR